MFIIIYMYLLSEVTVHYGYTYFCLTFEFIGAGERVCCMSMYKMNYSRYKVILRSDPTYMYIYSQMVQIQYFFFSLLYTLLYHPLRLLWVRCLRHLVSVYRTFFINIDFTLELNWQV